MKTPFFKHRIFYAALMLGCYLLYRFMDMYFYLLLGLAVLVYPVVVGGVKGWFGGNAAMQERAG